MNPKVVMGVRIFFGVFCLIFGLNKFLHFIPVPPMAGDGGTLMGIFMSSGFMTIIAILEILGGLALLANKYVPLALTIMIAIMFNAATIHGLFDPAGIVGSLLGLAMGLFLVYANKSRFSDLLRA